MNGSKSNDRQIAYSQAVWEITSALQEDRSLESALRSSLNKTIRFIGAEAGTIWYYNKDGSLYTDEDISLTTALAELTAIAIESRGFNLGIFAKKNAAPLAA